MSALQKRWEVVLSINLIICMAALMNPSSVRADSVEASSEIAKAEVTASRQDKNHQSKTSINSTVIVHSAPTFSVSKVEVVGSTILSAADLEFITQLIPQSTTTLADLNQAADAITQLYLEKGYTTTRAIVPPQKLENNGTITLQVIEGWLGDIRVNGNKELQPRYIKSRLRLAAGTPLNLQHIETQIRLLKNDPMLEDIKASLKAGMQPGESILVVDLKEAQRYTRNFSTDNYSSSNGLPDKTRLSARYLNPSGIGDELSFSSSIRPSQREQDESTLPPNYDVSYRLPVNTRDGAVQLRASLDNRLVGGVAFTSLGLRSRDEVYALTFRQPLMRSLHQEFGISLGFSAQRQQTFLFKDVPFPFDNSANSEGITQTRVLRFGQDYRRQDKAGVWSANSVANLGLGILNATQHDGPTPDGQFFSWQLQGQRVQRLGKGNLLIAQGNLQLSPDSLLSSEQFNLGGGQSVRGFRQNVRSGDNGWRFSLEGRFPIMKSAQKRPILQLTPFADAGAVWNTSHNPSGSIDQGFIAGAGLGFLWQPSKTTGIRLDYGIPLVNLRDRSNGFQNSGVYFSIVSEN
jgi:hemolysin activation/secretion protein